MESPRTRILEIRSESGLTASFAPDAGMVCCSLTHRGEQVLGLRGGLDAYIEKDRRRRADRRAVPLRQHPGRGLPLRPPPRARCRLHSDSILTSHFPGVPRTEWELAVPVAIGLELDDHGLPTGERVPVEPIAGPLRERTFDDAFLAPVGGEPLRLWGGGRRIEAAFDRGFPFAQLYAPPGEDLLAWEPMTAPTNALVSGEGLTIIAPGESYRAAFTVRVSDG